MVDFAYELVAGRYSRRESTEIKRMHDSNNEMGLTPDDIETLIEYRQEKAKQGTPKGEGA